MGESVATLTGKVNPNGSAVATCRFEYGTTAGYGAVAPCVPGSLGTGSFNVPVEAQIGALEPGTTYHYRVIAASVNGATSGIDQTFTTVGTPVCPNANRRHEQGIQAIQLPRCMALEQVSPPIKYSQRAASPTISVDGDRVSFLSLAALAETPGNISAFYGDTYVADRGSNGWSTTSTSPPYPIVIGWGSGAFLTRSFDPTLSKWLVIGAKEEEDQYQTGIAQVFRGGLGGLFEPISPLLKPTDGPHTRTNVQTSTVQGASEDHSRVFFAMGDASATYLPGDPSPAGAGSDKNIYEARLDVGGEPSIELLTRDEVGPNAGTAWGANCGARIGGIGGSGVGWRNQGAVALDGSLVYFSTRPAQAELVPCAEANKLRIMQREELPAGVEITELIESECVREAPDPLCSSTDGDDLFQGASVDQSKVYFTTNRQLADSDLDGDGFPSGCVGFLVGGCDLYLYDRSQPAGERLTQVSAGAATPEHPTPGSGAGVLNGTVAISGDGTRVYFTATGVLTAEGNPEGKSASEYPASTPKLYTWDTTGQVVEFVGALAEADASSLWAASGTFLNSAYPVPVTGTDGAGTEVGGSGDVLFFTSSAELTAVDSDGTRFDVYRYASDASPASLECVSCRPGGPDAEPFDVTTRGSDPQITGTGFAQAGRWVSEDGSTAMIRTSEALVAQDVNGVRDDYLWDEGELTLLPGTAFGSATSGLGQNPPVLSHDASEVAFTAYSPLLPSDGDTAPDVYVARSEGGFPNPVTPLVCNGEACQSPPGPAPLAAGAASADLVGRGNVKPRKQNFRCGKGKKKVVRKGKVRCVKSPNKKAGTAKKRAKRNQGGQK